MWEMEPFGMMPRFWLSFGRTSLFRIRGKRRGEREKKSGRRRSVSVHVGL